MYLDSHCHLKFGIFWNICISKQSYEANIYRTCSLIWYKKKTRIFLTRCALLANPIIANNSNLICVTLMPEYFVQLRSAEERCEQAEARAKELEKQVWISIYSLQKVIRISSRLIPSSQLQLQVVVKFLSSKSWFLLELILNVYFHCIYLWLLSSSSNKEVRASFLAIFTFNFSFTGCNTRWRCIPGSQIVEQVKSSCFASVLFLFDAWFWLFEWFTCRKEENLRQRQVIGEIKIGLHRCIVLLQWFFLDNKAFIHRPL